MLRGFDQGPPPTRLREAAGQGSEIWPHHRAAARPNVWSRIFLMPMGRCKKEPGVVRAPGQVNPSGHRGRDGAGLGKVSAARLAGM